MRSYSSRPPSDPVDCFLFSVRVVRSLSKFHGRERVDGLRIPRTHIPTVANAVRRPHWILLLRSTASRRGGGGGILPVPDRTDDKEEETATDPSLPFRLSDSDSVNQPAAAWNPCGYLLPSIDAR